MTTYAHSTALTPKLRAKLAAAAGDRASKLRFRDVAGIRLAHNLDSLSRDEIDATQQHNLRATLTAARQSTNVWREGQSYQPDGEWQLTMAYRSAGIE